MKARYLLRLDDANPFADMKKWDRIESLLDKYQVKPIVAVIPDNSDQSLMLSPLDQFFWSRVQQWQRKDWELALHGYQHNFHKVDKSSLIFPFYDRSEFGGLSLELQSKKIKAGVNILRSHNINPKVWIAPAHSFDRETMTALMNETDISIISDGLTVHPYFWQGFHFVPQQLWWFRRRYLGVWTVCLHPDTMTEDDFRALEKVFKNPFFKERLIKLDDLTLKRSRKRVLDWLYEISFWAKYRLRSALVNLIR